MPSYTANKVVINSFIIYLKLIIKLVVGLFTTRVVLNALGHTDYGIYSLVAGVIGMLGFLTSTMSTATMRFMAHSIGSNDQTLVKKTFNSSLIISFILGFMAVIIMEIGGIVMFEYFLNIPAARISDAKIVYHFMVASTFMVIISIPYDATLNAHENFLALSIIQISASLINLGIAIVITYLSANLLIYYGFFILLNQVLTRIIMQVYGYNKYDECKIKILKYCDKSQIKEILKFSGWVIFGVMGGVINIQSRSIFLNMFFGVLLNTANGVAMTLSNQLNNFSVSMTQAINPRIIRNEGGGKRDKMLSLSNISTKFSVYLFALFAIPVFLEAPFLLRLWLKNVPEFAIIFTRLIIISMFLEKFTFQLTIVINAVGKIRGITLIGLAIVLLSFPLIYILFKMGYPPYTIYIIGILMNFTSAISRLYFAKKLAGLDIRKFLYTIVWKGFFPLVMPIILASLLLVFFEESFLRLILLVFISLLTSLLLVRFLGLTHDEYERIRTMIVSVIKKSRNANHDANVMKIPESSQYKEYDI